MKFSGKVRNGPMNDSHSYILIKLKLGCKHKTILQSSTMIYRMALVEYFRDFCEFRYDHENFCYEIFLTLASSTLQNHEKPVNHKNQARSQKFKTTEIWSHTVQLMYV